MSEFHDDYPQYEFMAHHSEEEGKVMRRKLWNVFWIMLAVTIAELIIGSFAKDWHLLDPELNIRLGSTYLKRLLKTFDGNMLLATAAYNVGPTRIKNYQSLYRRLPKDVWVEILPWKETRDYIKSVSLARNIYNQI